MAAKAKPVDWIAVEAEYRAGILTDRAIAQAHGVSHGAIQKRAKKEGWSRDLAKRIAKRRDEKVAKAAVAKHGSQMSLATDKQVVEANAELQTGIILSHRKDIQVLRITVAEMAAELGAAGSKDLQEALDLVLAEKVIDLSNQQAKTALYKAFDAALALGGRSTAARNLVSSLSTLIDKERQAHGIDREGGEGKSLGEFLESLT